jgi:plastocyanin domain-containing protein
LEKITNLARIIFLLKQEKMNKIIARYADGNGEVLVETTTGYQPGRLGFFSLLQAETAFQMSILPSQP